MIGEGNGGFDFPRFEFGCVGALTVVVGTQTLLEVLGKANVMSFGVSLRTENVDVEEFHLWVLACRAVASRSAVPAGRQVVHLARLRPRASARQPSHLRSARSEGWWRRRESNPRPKAFRLSFYMLSLRFGCSPLGTPAGRLPIRLAYWILALSTVGVVLTAISLSRRSKPASREKAGGTVAAYAATAYA